jgi:hypothetical protein
MSRLSRTAYVLRLYRQSLSRPHHITHFIIIASTLTLFITEPPCAFEAMASADITHTTHNQTVYLKADQPPPFYQQSVRHWVISAIEGDLTSCSCQGARAASQGLSRPHRHCADTSPSMHSTHPLHSPPGVDIGRVGPRPTVSTKNQPACGSLSCPGDTHLRLVRLLGDMHSRAHCLPGSGRSPIRSPDNIGYSGSGL